jgi:hypothetical protein
MGTLHEDFSNLWQYLTQFYLERETFQIKVVDKNKTHLLCSETFLWKSRCLWDNVEKCGGTRRDADNMTPAHGILDELASTCLCFCTHTHSSTPTPTSTHARKQKYVILFSMTTVVLQMYLSVTLHVQCLSRQTDVFVCNVTSPGSIA